MSTLNQQQQEPKRFRRIRVDKLRNTGTLKYIHSLYPLLISYLEHPEFTLCLKEIVFKHNYPKTHDDPDWYHGATPQFHNPRNEEDTRDVSDEPLIARGVECLGLKDDAQKEKWIRILSWRKPELDGFSEALATTSAFLSRFTDRNCYKYINACNSLFAHYAVALIMVLYPNLETLVLEAPAIDGSPMLEVLLRNNYDMLPNRHLQKLKNITFFHIPKTYLGSPLDVTCDLLGHVRLFHRLPSVEFMEVETMAQLGYRKSLEELPSRTSNMKRLRLFNCKYGSRDISTLIRVPKALEEFTWSAGAKFLSKGPSYPKNIGKALLEHKTTLRRIDIDVDEDSLSHYVDDKVTPEEDEPAEWYTKMPGDWQQYLLRNRANECWRSDMAISNKRPAYHLPDTREYRGTIGSLHDFEVLTHLSISVGLLLGPMSKTKPHSAQQAPFRLVNALPRSLEYLCIKGYEWGRCVKYDEQIVDLLALKEELLPRLGQVLEVSEEIPVGTLVGATRISTAYRGGENVDDDWLEAEGE